MDEELKKLLMLSVKSVKGLTDSLNKKESAGEANIKAAVHKQTSSNIDILTDIKKTLERALKHQIKTAKEQEFESKKAKKVEEKTTPEKADTGGGGGGEIIKGGGGWLRKLLLILLALIAVFRPEWIIALFEGMTKFFQGLNAVWNSVKTYFTSGTLILFKKTLDGIRAGVRAIFGKAGVFAKFFGKNSAIGKFFIKIFGKGSTLGKLFRGIKNFLKPVFNFFRTVFKPILTFVSTLFKAGGGGIFTKILSFVKIGIRGLGKIFWPITILMSILDFVKGFKNTEGSVFEKILGGLGEMFAGLIGMPLDLIKNAIAWIFEKFGWENLAEKLRNFSFAEGIREMFQKIPDIIDKLKETVGKIKDTIGDFFSGDNAIGNVVQLLFWPINLIKSIAVFFKGFKAEREAGGTVFESIIAGLKAAWDSFVGVIQNLWDTLVGLIPDPVKDFFTRIGEIGQGVFLGIQDAIMKIINFFTNLINKIRGFTQRGDEVVFDPTGNEGRGQWYRKRSGTGMLGSQEAFVEIDESELNQMENVRQVSIAESQRIAAEHGKQFAFGRTGQGRRNDPRATGSTGRGLDVIEMDARQRAADLAAAGAGGINRGENAITTVFADERINLHQNNFRGEESALNSYLNFGMPQILAGR